MALKQAVPAANVSWVLAGTPEDVSRTVVPGTARAGVDLRFEGDGEALLETARAAMPDGVELVLKSTCPPASAPVDGRPVTAMAAAMRRQGATPRVYAQAPWWAPYHIFGAPFAAGGLGRAGGAHGPDEWCEVDGLRRAHAPGPRHAGRAMRLRYEEHTWPELRELARRDDLVVVVPTATLEDHGHHLPIDTDARLVNAICERAVAAAGGQALLFPTQVHGYTPHHMDFPGSVTLRWNVFVESLLDQGRSLCRHGFDRILFVNGHGSNQPLVDIAARLIGVEHRDAVCGSCFYLQSERGKEVIAEVRDSERPGGMAHACELETSIYLALAPELVQMDKAVQRDPRLGLGARVARLVRRPALGVAALVGPEPQWSGRRRDCGHRGEGRAVAFRRGG